MTDATRRAALTMGFLALACWSGGAQAASPCPLPGQTPMLVARLYFGESGGKPFTAKAWRTFLAQSVTPRFPQGFTVYDARGQWLDPRTKIIAGENSKVIEIAVADSGAARGKIGELARAYREGFRQQAVGIVTTTACASF